MHNHESDRLYNCNARPVAHSLPRLQRFVFFVSEFSAISHRRFERLFENEENPDVSDNGNAIARHNFAAQQRFGRDAQKCNSYLEHVFEFS